MPAVFCLSSPTSASYPLPSCASHLTHGPSASLCGPCRGRGTCLFQDPIPWLAVQDRRVVGAAGWGERGGWTATAGGLDDLTQSIPSRGVLIYLINSGPQAGEGKRQDIKSVALTNLSQGCQHTWILLLPPLLTTSSRGRGLCQFVRTLPGSRQQIAGGEEECGGPRGAGGGGEGGGQAQEPFRRQLL